MKSTPFSEIKVVDVCKKAGVSKNTFYRHFTGLSDVIYQAVGEIDEQLFASVANISAENPKLIIDLICNAWYKNRVLFRGFTQSSVIYITQEFIKKDAEKFFCLLHGGDGIEFFSEFSSAALCSFLCLWSRHDFADSPEKISLLIYKCLCENVFDAMRSFIAAQDC